MWEIYSFGRTPYPKMSQKEVVDNVLKGYRMEMPENTPKVRACCLVPDCPHAAQDVYEKAILACWEIDPGKRPTFKVGCIMCACIAFVNAAHRNSRASWPNSKCDVCVVN